MVSTSWELRFGVCHGSALTILGFDGKPANRRSWSLARREKKTDVKLENWVILTLTWCYDYLPLYLTWIVSYEDVRVTILNRIITLIHFPVSDLVFAFIFTFNLVLQRHDDVTSSSFKLKMKVDLKNL